MDRVKKEIKTIQNTLDGFKDVLVMCENGIKDGEKNQEYLELRLASNEYHEARLERLEQYINVIHKHLNDIISRVNDIHVYLRNRDLQCYEVMEDSDDEKTV